ncbi:MAG: amidase [Planctomycetales bacterium]
MPSDPHLIPEELETVHGLHKRLYHGKISCREILAHVLEQIDRWEPTIHAWVSIHKDAALEQARKLDAEREAGHIRGPLHGIPLGIKDLYDWEGLPTAAGYAPWEELRAAADAPVVARLRAAGAVLLGKTVTTQFASFDPPVTRNPWNVARTTGGSSSGSAAAVATGMCIAAMGSQTGGSITRPATYCGVAGFKPSFGVIELEGIIPLAPAMDHPGPMARSVRDLAIISGLLAPTVCGDPVEWVNAPLITPPRIGILREQFETLADPIYHTRMREVANIFRAAGATLLDVPLFPGFEEVIRMHRRIMATEAARYHRERLATQREHILPWVTSLMEEGLKTTEEEYQDAIAHQLNAKSLVPELFRHCDVVICPATSGPAPDASSTGNPCMNSPSSFLGIPAASFPIGLSDDHMPLGLQILGPAMADKQVLQVALWCETIWQQAQSGDVVP